MKNKKEHILVTRDFQISTRTCTTAINVHVDTYIHTCIHAYNNTQTVYTMYIPLKLDHVHIYFHNDAIGTTLHKHLQYTSTH